MNGFVTKNACREVSAETISRWYAEKPSCSLDDFADMPEIKELLSNTVDLVGAELDCESPLSIYPISLFFYGPPGSAKTRAAYALASELMEHGWKFINLTGADIHAHLVGASEKTLELAFKEAADNAPCVILFDYIETVCMNRASESAGKNAAALTNAFLKSFAQLKQNHRRVIVIGATSSPCMVDRAYTDRCTQVKFSMPSKTEREKFLAKRFKTLTLEENFSFEEMAAATENCNFHELSRIYEELMWIIKRRVLEMCRVTNADGSIDCKATDDAAVEVVYSGRIKVGRADFETALEKRPPFDKTVFLAEIERYEKLCDSGC